MTDIFDEAAESAGNQSAIAAKRLNYGSTTANPDEAAKAKNLSRELDIPPSLIEGDIIPFEQRARTKRNSQILDGNEALTSWLNSNPFDARVTNDDFASLDVLSKTLTALNTGWKEGELSTKRGRLGFAGGQPEELKAVEKELAALPKLPEPFGFIAGVPATISGIMENVAASWPYAAAGAVAGAPAEGVGAIPGFLFGAGYGTIADMAKTSAGNTYLDSEQWLDKNGKPLPETTRRNAAIFVGIGTLAVGLAAGPTLGAPTKMAMENLFQQAVKEAISRPTIQRSLAKVATSFGRAGATGAQFTLGLETVRAMTEQFAKIGSDQDFNTILNNEGERQAFIDRLVGAASQGFLTFGVLHLPAAGIDFMADRIHANQAKMDANRLRAAENTVLQSKTKQRSPEVIKSLVEHTLRGTDTENVYIPTDVITKMYLELGIKPGAKGDPLRFVGDMKSQIDQGLATGGDVKISTGDWLAHVAGKPIADQLRPDLRLRPDGLSLNGAKEIKEPEAKGPEEEEALRSFFMTEDLPSFMKQAAESWLEVAMEAAKREGAPEVAVERATTPAEALVKAFEGTMRGEKSPKETRAALRSFTPFVLRAFEKAQAEGVPMAEDVREALMRLSTAEAATRAARDAQYLHPLFADAKSVGMTPDQFKAYSKKIEKIQGEIDARILEKAMRAIQRRKSKEWRDAETGLRDEVTKAIDDRPDVKARDAMLESEFKVAPHFIVNLYGEKSGDFFYPGVMKKGGVDPDELAPLFGYTTGKEMLDEQIRLEAERRRLQEETGKPVTPKQHKRQLINDEVRQRLVEKFGDAVDLGTILDEAMKEVRSQAGLDLISDEMRTLAAKTGQDFPFTLDVIKSYAQKILNSMNITDALSSSKFVKQAGKAGRDAEKALLRGDYADAFQKKQKQFLNLTMANESDAISALYEKSIDEFTHLARTPKLSSVAQEYMNWAHSILARLGFKLKRDPAELAGALKGQTLEGFAQGLINDGAEIFVSPDLLDPNFSKSISQMTVQEFTDIANTIISLMTNGRNEKKITILGEKLDFEDVKAEAIANIESLRQRVTKIEFDPKNVKSMLGSLMHLANASFRVPEALIDIADKNNIRGPFNAVYRGLHAAAAFREEMTTELTKLLKSKQPSLEWRRRLKEMVDVPELQYKGRRLVTDRRTLVGLMLHVGTESNFDKLARGWEIDPTKVWSVIRRLATKEDYDFVQHYWDSIESLWPKVEEMTRRLNGLAPEKNQARAFYTPYGRYRGGYFPIVYDRMYAPEVKTRAEEGFLSQNYQRATTPRGYTISRIKNFAAPIDLSFDRAPTRIAQVIHDIAFREAVNDARKLFMDKDVLRALTLAWGPEYTDHILPWLKSIANDRVIDFRPHEFIDNVMRWSRTGVTMVGIGFRLSVMGKHALTAMFHSIVESGEEPFISSFREFVQHPIKMSDEIMEKSAMMRYRFRTLDRDINYVLSNIAGKSGVKEHLQEWAMWGVGLSDWISAAPLWHATYNSALLKGLSEADAIYAADKATRRAHGSGLAIDLPGMMRGPELMKQFTIFMTFMNRMYNREVDIYNLVEEGMIQKKSGDSVGARRNFSRALRLSMGYIVWSSIVESLISPSQVGIEPDDDIMDWIAKSAAWQVLAPIPGGRNLAHIVATGQALPATPIESALGTSFQVARDFSRLFSPKDVSHKWVQHSVETLGYAMGLPTGQPALAAQFLWDYHNGDVNPKDAYDWFVGLTSGKEPLSERSK